MVADALSRRPATLSLMSLDIYWRAQLLVEYSKDRFACEVLDGKVTMTDELPPMDDEGHLVLQPEAIIDTRERQL